MQDWETLLARILETEKELTEKLLTLSEKQKAVIAEDDSAALEEIINGQQPLLMQFENLEQERLELLDKTGLGGLTLRQIVSHASESRGKGRLEELLGQFPATIQKLGKINDVNNALIHSRLDLINSIKTAVLGGAVLYGPGGGKTGVRPDGLMDTKA